MTTLLSFDHVVILMLDLDKASADYRMLGFNVFYGGQHADGKTHNALIVFKDGTYIELLAPTNPSLVANYDPNNRTSFLFMFAAGEEFGGYALRSENLAAGVEAMQMRGLDIQLRSPAGRLRPDSTKLEWQSAMLPGTMTPFFIQDITPRNLRVPDEAEKTNHPNGVQRIVSITIPTHDLQAGVEYYQQILGQEPNPLNPNNDPEPPTYAIFDVSPSSIVLKSGLQDAKIGVPYAIGLLSHGNQGFVDLDMTLTHGARISLQPF
jgi:catechol 2,3-dioxygenase-like lactoylglutathione lyase family enzyme